MVPFALSLAAVQAVGNLLSIAHLFNRPRLPGAVLVDEVAEE